MNEPLLTLQVNTTNRLSAYPDYNQYAIEDILSDEVGVATLRIDTHYREISQMLDEHIDRAIAHFVDRFNYYSHKNYGALREEAISRYLAFEGYACEFVSLRGYSQGEWAEVVIYRKLDEAQYLKYDKETLNAWFAGDIYTIAHEHLVTYVDTQDPDNKIERWETLDDIHAIIDDNIFRQQSLADYLSSFSLEVKA